MTPTAKLIPLHFALLLLLAVSQATADPFPLTLMTFNIRYGTADDGENSWEKRRDLLVDTIRQSHPDIVGTQETLDFQAAYIASQLPGYLRFGMGRDADGTGERMEVFYRADAVSPVETGNFWFSPTPEVPGSSGWESACNRMATWARFYHHGSATYFYLFNTHFDHISEEARRNAARILSERFRTLPPGIPLFLLGDFNSRAGDSVPYAMLTAAGLSDAWPTAKKRIGPATTWSGFAAPEPGVESRIDWILYRGGGIVAQECETVLHHEGPQYPSDHFPVLAKFILDKKDFLE